MAEVNNEAAEKAAKLDADHLKAGTIQGIISELNNGLAKAESELDKMTYSPNSADFEAALKSVATLVSSGSHVDFIRKNRWLGEKAQRSAHLNGGWSEGEEDKFLVCDFFDLVSASTKFRSEFAEFVTNSIQGSMLTAADALCFEDNLSRRISGEDLAEISLAFAEFDSVYNKYNNASIFSELQIKKEDGFDVNLEAVLDHMDLALLNKKNLCKFLMNTKTTTASGINKLYSLDRTTAQFDKFGSREDAIRRALKKIEDFNAALDGFQVAIGNEVRGYLRGYQRILDIMEKVYRQAIDVINNFKNKKNEVPYAVMHYDAIVKDCVSKHMLGSLSDPFSRGTNYNSLAENMLDRCRQLARSVAKNAPA